MPRMPTRVLPQRTVLLAGPLIGMRDAPEPTAAQPDKALLVQNMVATPGPRNAGLTSRPGFTGMEPRFPLLAEDGSPLLAEDGSPLVVETTIAPGACQAILTWTTATGSRETTSIVGGKVYGYSWTTETWTEVVTTANLTSASLTLSSTARVALVPFADGLVVSDGVNTPFWWDGTAGAGGLTKMTNAPVFYGPPCVYYAKLMGIKASSRNTLVWSEEGAPNLGYEAGGYNNAWDNPGGLSDPLTSVAGTNEALYVFRERFSIAITGAISADFATAGTRSNLSEDIGTLSPWATYVTSDGVLLVDADAQPWLMALGRAPTPLWEDCRQTVRGTPRAALGEIQTVQDDATYSYVVGFPEVGQTSISAFLCFSQRDWTFCGVWAWPESVQRIGPVVDGNGVARWAHGGVDDGQWYVHGDLEDGPWNDALISGTQYIAQAVVTSALGYDLDRELTLSEIEAAMTGDVSNVAVSYETPRGQSVPQNVAINAGGGGAWDVSDWDTFDWAGSTRDSRVRVGVSARGRWVRVRVAHSEDAEPFGLTVVRVTAHATQGNPRVP